MFDFTNEKMEEKMVENKARDMFANLLVEAILTSESAPEHTKLCVCVMKKAKDIAEITHGIIKMYVTPGNEANTKTLKKVMEYLEFVEVGIKQFIETTPFVANTEEE